MHFAIARLLTKQYDSMVIKSKVSFKEYLKLLYSLTYKKPVMRLIVFVAFAMLVWIVGYYTKILPLPEPTFYQYITLVLITIVQPAVIYYTIWKNYHSSYHLKEILEIEFTPKEIKISGESFYTVFTWEKTYKVQELNNWFLIYQNSLSAIIIPKKSLRNQIKEFRQLLQETRTVPLHLKTNTSR